MRCVERIKITRVPKTAILLDLTFYHFVIQDNKAICNCMIQYQVQNLCYFTFKIKMPRNLPRPPSTFCRQQGGGVFRRQGSCEGHRALVGRSTAHRAPQQLQEQTTQEANQTESGPCSKWKLDENQFHSKERTSDLFPVSKYFFHYYLKTTLII